MIKTEIIKNNRKQILRHLVFCQLRLKKKIKRKTGREKTILWETFISLN